MHTVYHMLEVAHRELVVDPCGTLADAFEACNMHLRMMACEEVLEVRMIDARQAEVTVFSERRLVCRPLLFESSTELELLARRHVDVERPIDEVIERSRQRDVERWVNPRSGILKMNYLAHHLCQEQTFLSTPTKLGSLQLS